MSQSGYVESIQVTELEDGRWAWSAAVGNRGGQQGTAGTRDEAWAAARRAVDGLNAGSDPREG